MSNAQEQPQYVDAIRYASRGGNTPYESELYEYRGRLFRVDKFDDDYGDTSHYGEFCERFDKDKPFVDRRTGTLLLYTGVYADVADNEEEPEHDGYEILRDDLGKNAFDRWDYAYWVPCNNHLADLGENWTREQAIEALCQDYHRLEGYGEYWQMMGVQVSLIKEEFREQAENDPEEVTKTFYEATDSLWGCETDVKDFIADYALDMMQGLLSGDTELPCINLVSPLCDPDGKGGWVQTRGI